MSGDPFRFALYDNVEEAWRIVNHALKGEMPVHGKKP
jgi:glucose-6-phosphate 1-dehydrogenase